MEPTYTGVKNIDRDGQDYSAEVTLRMRPYQGAIGVGFSNEAERYFNSTFGADFAELSNAMSGNRSSRSSSPPDGGSRSGPAASPIPFVAAEVVRVHVSQGASREDTAHLLAEASREAAEQYFAAVDDGGVHLDASDGEQPFEYLPSTGFDEEFISRRQCFLEYVAEKRPGFLFGIRR